MKDDVRAKWIEALRSGEYKQHKGSLKGGECFCVIGVLCDIHRNETKGPDWRVEANFDSEGRPSPGPCYMGHFYEMPRAVLEWAGIDNLAGPEVSINCVMGESEEPQDHTRHIQIMNDHGISFAEIADALERLEQEVPQ